MIPDYIHHPAPPAPPNSSATAEYHIYLIPGNPGLISIYAHFLAHLHHALNRPNAQARFSVRGRSAGGFEQHPPFPSQRPLSLSAQIRHIEAALQAEFPRGDERIVLVGHSVGAFIALEILARKGVKVEAVVLLFPTIVDIALSEGGRRATPILGLWEGVPKMVGGMVGVLVGLMTLGGKWVGGLRWIVSKVMGLKYGEEEAAVVTAEFLRGGERVEQALNMARDEMREITHDRWEDDIWLAAAPNTNSVKVGAAERALKPFKTRLFFYFGRIDHWVSNYTRDDIIASRGDPSLKTCEEAAVRSQPWMEIDEMGVPHAFCVRPEHSELVAEKCQEFVEAFVKADEQP